MIELITGRDLNHRWPLQSQSIVFPNFVHQHHPVAEDKGRRMSRRGQAEIKLRFKLFGTNSADLLAIAIAEIGMFNAQFGLLTSISNCSAD